MFSRNGVGAPISHFQHQQQVMENAYHPAAHAEQAITGIVMSPMGLPIPSDLPLPATSSSISSRLPNPTSLAESRNTTDSASKPLSYASAAGAVTPLSPSPSASPGRSKLTSPPMTPSVLSGPSSPDPGAPFAKLSAGTNGTHVATLRTASSLSPATASNAARLSASVPSAFPMEGVHASSFYDLHSPVHHLAHQPHHHSPLAPSMQHSQSHTFANPSRSLLSHTHALGSPSAIGLGSVPNIGLGMPPNHRSASGSGIFGTSPFGKNAIFLSSSHEDDKDTYISRASRTPEGGREMSPIGFEREGLRRGSFDGRALQSGPPSNHNDSAIGEEVDGESNIMEELLVPSSLNHLLTPDEKARRSSRSGANGLFSPFDDTEDQEDERDLQRYSRSVPAPALYQNAPTFQKAPGSPPVSARYTNGSLHPNTVFNDGVGPHLATGNTTSNLAKHLLAGQNAPHSHPYPPHSHSPPRIERGFYSSTSSSPAPHSNMASGAAGGNSNPVLGGMSGSSLPQGLAAGLSRLHLIPAGAERTGYTPQGSFVSSPPPGITSTPSGSHHLSPADNTNKSNLASSYSMKLPSLASARKVSGNHQGEAGIPGHIGSPLARNGLPSYTGLASQGHRAQNPEKSNTSTPPHEREDEELLFDMDV